MRHLSARRVAAWCVISCAMTAALSLARPTGRVATQDRNGDGQPDIWQRYDDHGQLSEVDVDSNFDGKADVEEFYARGALVRRESDRNFNGRIDLVEEFDATTEERTRSLVDIDDDGIAD